MYMFGKRKKIGSNMGGDTVKFKVESQNSVVLVEEGVYEGKLVSLEIAEIETSQGKREILRWTFEIEYEDSVIELQGITSTKLSVGKNPSKFYRWTTTLLGRELEVGEEIDTDELIGKRCMVIVENKKLSNGTEISRVVDIKRIKKLKSRKSKKKKSDEEEDEVIEA